MDLYHGHRQHGRMSAEKRGRETEEEINTEKSESYRVIGIQKDK